MTHSTITPTAVNWNSSPAFAWGREDGLAGADRRGSLYFSMDSFDYAAYNAGFDAGKALEAAAQVAPNNRAGRAMQLVASGAVQRNGNGYYVHSQSNGSVYRTTENGCDCPDATYNKATCKHILAVRMVARQNAVIDELDAALAEIRAAAHSVPALLSDEALEEAERELLHTDWRR